MRDLVEQIVDAPSNHLTDLEQRAAANVADTPVLANATTDDGDTIELRGSAAGGASAICANRGGTPNCRPGMFGVADMVTATVDDGGTTVIFGATRAEPSFNGAELRSPAWIVQSNGWHLFRVEPRAVSIVVTAGGHGLQTAFTAEAP